MIFAEYAFNYYALHRMQYIIIFADSACMPVTNLLWVRVYCSFIDMLIIMKSMLCGAHAYCRDECIGGGGQGSEEER
jgi:hypothetical protein